MMEKALINACINNQLSVIKVLITKKLNLDYADDFGKTALIYCAENGNLDAVKTLVNSGADPGRTDHDSDTVLHKAVQSQNTELPKFLLTLPGIDVNCRNVRGETPLFLAAATGNRDMVEMLMKAGARDLANNGSITALDVASANGASSIVELIISGNPGSE